MLLTTSSFLPRDEFPQFASEAPLGWDIPGGPFDPHTGDWYVYSQQADVSYKRFSTTVDLSGATSGELNFWTSYDTEADWDFLFVEAHEVGSDDWTTLPEAAGHTTHETGESCLAGWVDQLHPFLAHYMDASCAPTGTTGEWNAATGASNGWTEWSVDLSGVRRLAGRGLDLLRQRLGDPEHRRLPRRRLGPRGRSVRLRDRVRGRPRRLDRLGFAGRVGR